MSLLNFHQLHCPHAQHSNICDYSSPSHHPVIEPMQPKDLQRLVTTQMPFGKYQGRLIADLPGQYLNWFAREGFPKSDLGRLLELMHEIDHNGLSDLLTPLRNTR